MATFSKKTWKARVSQYPNRRTLTKTNGSTEVVTVERNEGTVSQQGDAFSANAMNDLEDRISGMFIDSPVSVTSTVGTISKLHSYQVGKLVHVNFTLTLSSAVSAWAVIATITGAKPADHTSGHFVDTQTPSNSGALRVLSNGSVNILSGITTGHALEINLTYYSNN